MNASGPLPQAHSEALLHTERVKRVIRSYRTSVFETEVMRIQTSAVTDVPAGQWISLYRPTRGSISVTLEGLSPLTCEEGGLFAVMNARPHSLAALAEQAAQVSCLRLLKRTHLLSDSIPTIGGLEPQSVADIPGFDGYWAALFVDDPRPSHIVHEIRCRLADAVAISFLEKIINQKLEQSFHLPTDIYDKRIRLVLKSMNTRLSYAWTLKELSDLAAMSRANFARKFLRAVGDPPMRYLQFLRIAHAKALLEADHTPIGEVARQTGFQSDIAFHRAFKRQTGMTPGRYRQIRTERLAVR